MPLQCWIFGHFWRETHENRYGMATRQECVCCGSAREWLGGEYKHESALMLDENIILKQQDTIAALQAEVARLKDLLDVAVEQARLHDEEQQAALREAGWDAERWRFLTSMDVGEYIGLVEYNNPDELAHAIDAARLVRDGDSGEGES